MRNYATHQSTGGRDFQCDATAVATVNGVRAYALLDGIGDKPYVRDWTRAAARRMARTAARRVVKDAVATARTVTSRPDNATALVADLYV